MSSLLQEVFRRHYPAYVATHKLPRHQLRAGYLIGACRSAALGGHVQGCPGGHVLRIQYNSCRHRLCEQCAGLARQRWLQAELSRLLPCAHRHIVFTIPHALNPLWSHNRARMADALFEASAATLKELLGDARYLGAQAGMLLALHTWGRALWLHPHIHALVSEGGLMNGDWVLPRRAHFLPARVAMMLFRGKFLARLRADLAAGALVLPADTSAQRIANLLNKLGRRRWNVRVCERYAHGEGVVRYLARYVRGGPLKGQQLLPPAGHAVGFSYRPHGEDGSPEGIRHVRLAPEDFLERYLTHTPMPGQHQVRRYGLYAPVQSQALARARNAVLAQAGGDPSPPPPTPAPPLTWQAYLARFAHPSPAHTCPVCAQPIVFLARLTHPRAPP